MQTEAEEPWVKLSWSEMNVCLRSVGRCLGEGRDMCADTLLLLSSTGRQGAERIGRALRRADGRARVHNTAARLPQRRVYRSIGSISRSS